MDAPSTMFVIQALGRGGAERQLVTLARALHERGAAVTVAVFRGGGALEQALDDSRVPLVRLTSGRRRSVFVVAWHLLRLIRAQRPDVVHGYLAVPNLVLSLLKPTLPRGTKVVWGVRHAELRLRDFGWSSRIAETLARPASRAADLIIVNSRAGRDDHARLGYPRARMVVIENGIDTQLFRPDPAARVRRRRELGVEDAQPLVGLVARVDPTKAHHVFVAAADVVAARRPEVHFVCVGAATAQERATLSEPAVRSGWDSRLHWTGARDDVAEWYAALDVCCLSSVTEGFPNVVGEAMAAGVPCVVTDVGDAKAVVGDLGEAVPSGDAEALGVAISRMLDRLEATPTLHSEVRRRIEETYSVARLVERTTDALRTVAYGTTAVAPSAAGFEPPAKTG